MREILFRAKRLDNGEWIYGYVMNDKHKSLGRYNSAYDFYVEKIDTKTVGQYTGLKDKNGNKIFEGDYLGDWCENDDGEECLGAYGAVTWWESDARYMLTTEEGLANDWTYEEEAHPTNWGNLYIVGNIHDNPEIFGDK